MDLQKRLASRLLNCGPGRVRFDTTQLEEIKKAITRFDIQRLINKGLIAKVQEQGVSRARAKHRAEQRKKGRQSGHGSRKGKSTARRNPKTVWVQAVRAQRELIKALRAGGHVDNEGFKELYAKVKGGFFRSTKHIKIYTKEQDMIKTAAKPAAKEAANAVKQNGKQ